MISFEELKNMVNEFFLPNVLLGLINISYIDDDKLGVIIIYDKDNAACFSVHHVTPYDNPQNNFFLNTYYFDDREVLMAKSNEETREILQYCYDRIEEMIKNESF